MRCARRELGALCTVAFCAASTSVAAQAWLPARGELGYSVTYNNVLNQKHYLPDGAEDDAGSARVYTVGLAASYGLTDRLTVIAGIPWVSSHYRGERAHPTEVDDGHYHDTLTDFRVQLHYQATDGQIAFAPFVAAIIPSTDYETLGHAAPGRGLEEYWLGFYAGSNLDDWIPRTYVQVRYTYAFVEKVAAIAHDRSNVDFEIGYFLTPEWSLRGVVLWQGTHGGIPVPIPRTDPLFPFHDQLGAEGFTNAALGASWSVSRRMELFALAATSLRGKNGHKLDQGFTLGYAYRFGVSPR